MTPEERQQSLAAARRACEWLRDAYIDSLADEYVSDFPLPADEQARRNEVMSLVAEFRRLDDGEQKRNAAGREGGPLGAEFGHLGGRPRKTTRKRKGKK